MWGTGNVKRTGVGEGAALLTSLQTNETQRLHFSLFGTGRAVCVLTQGLEDPALLVTCGLDPHLSKGIMCQFWHSTDAVDLGS